VSTAPASAGGIVDDDRLQHAEALILRPQLDDVLQRYRSELADRRGAVVVGVRPRQQHVLARKIAFEVIIEIAQRRVVLERRNAARDRMREVRAV
jgi:hypothetical protein